MQVSNYKSKHTRKNCQFFGHKNYAVLSRIWTRDLSVTSQCSNWQVLSYNPTWGKILSHVLKIANFYCCAVMLSYFFSLFWRRNQKSVNHLVHWDPELGFFSVCANVQRLQKTIWPSSNAIYWTNSENATKSGMKTNKELIIIYLRYYIYCYGVGSPTKVSCLQFLEKPSFLCGPLHRK